MIQNFRIRNFDDFGDKSSNPKYIIKLINSTFITAGAGFAYQLHHRVPCLIMSYVTGMPLIHTVDHDGWYYLHPWSHVFTLLGTNCTPGNNTFVWNWHNDGCSGEGEYLYMQRKKTFAHVRIYFRVTVLNIFNLFILRMTTDGQILSVFTNLIDQKGFKIYILFFYIFLGF